MERQHLATPPRPNLNIGATRSPDTVSRALNAPRRRWGLEVLGLLCGSIALTIASAYSRGEHTDAAFLLGSSAVPFLVSLVFLKRSLAAAAISVVVVVGLSHYGASNYDNHQAKDRRAVEAMADAIDERKKAVQGASAEPEQSQDQIQRPDVTAYVSPIQNVSDLVTAFQRRARVLEKSYGESISSLGEILTPDRLISEEGISENRKALAVASEGLSTYRNASESLTEEFDTKILALAEDPAYTSLLAGYRNGKAKRDARSSRVFDNQEQLISVASDLNEFMADQLGNTQVQGNQIIFSTDELAQRYNGLVSRIQELAAEEEKLRLEQVKVLDQLSAELRTLNSNR
ncbi:hypothetical protein [Pseudoxanthomonas mexicana]